MVIKPVNIQRQSNMELLRIVAMLAVIAVHLDGASLGLPSPQANISLLSRDDWWRLAMEAVTIVGVNCFTLISGYFGIRTSFKGFTIFSIWCLVYSVGICSVVMLIRAYTGSDVCSFGEWIESWLIYTHNDLWYVPAYLGLYLLAPFLNSAINNLSQKLYFVYLAAFVAFNVYCGWFWGGSFNPTGYTLVHLIMMYLIGLYIGKYFTLTDGNRRNVRLRSYIIYVISTILITLMAAVTESNFAFAYNSPLVIVSSVALFIVFATLQFNSKWINYVASSAFAAYLIHKNPYIWGGFIKPFTKSVWENSSLLEFTLFYILFALFVFALSVLVDIVRRAIFRRLGLAK